MVKNTNGGNKAKNQASKNSSIKSTRITRFAKNADEIYAVVETMLGNGKCHVKCFDSEKLRLMHIRGKFKGRGKRDNFVSNGSFVLVGIREYELKREITDNKLENCDLLEVYTDVEKEVIRNREKHFDSKLFLPTDRMFNTTGKEAFAEFDFIANDVEEEYEELTKNQADIKMAIDDNVIDIDDI